MLPPELIPSKENVAHWVKIMAPIHCRLALPASFEEYWNGVERNARNRTNHAKKLGYTAVWTTSPHHTDIGAIWRSWRGSTKQGRNINSIFHCVDLSLGAFDLFQGWPFNYYNETKGYVDMVEVLDAEGRAVAYIELVSNGGDTVVFSTLGHKDHLKHGVMRLLFMEVARGLIERGDKAFFYNKPTFVKNNPQKAFFLKEFGFSLEAQPCPR